MSIEAGFFLIGFFVFVVAAALTIPIERAFPRAEKLIASIGLSGVAIMIVSGFLWILTYR